MDPVSLTLAMQVGGTVLGAVGAYGESQSYRAAAKYGTQAAAFQAAQLEQDAKTSIGMGQRAAAEERRQAEIAQSRILALAAASGGGASDPTVVNLIARQAQEGAYRANLALYEGDEAARKMRLQAAGITTGAQAESELLKAKAQTTLVKGITGAATSAAETFGPSLYEKYAQPSGPMEYNLGYWT